MARLAPSSIDAAVGTIKLGGTLTIPRLGFGAMQLPGRPNGPTVDQATAEAVARRAVELGVRHLDTAAFYVRGPNRANDILRTALHPCPAGLTIATKVGPLRTSTGEMCGEARPEQLRSAVEQNLQELAVDVLDLVYLRVGRLAAGGSDPIGERFTALAELRDEGLIRHLGVSNVTAEQLDEARAIAPVAAVQNRFGCSTSGTPGWWMSARTPASPGGGHARLASRNLHQVARRHGATVFQVAIAWGLARSPSIVQIPGTASLAHLEENMAAAYLKLDEADMALLGHR